MPPTAADPSNDALTAQARAGVRNVPWQRLAVGAAGASALGLLGAAGLAPLLAAAGGNVLVQGAMVNWVLALGGSVLANWVSDLVPWAVGQALNRDDDPDAQLVAIQALAQQLDTLLARTPAAAGELSSLLVAIDALPQRLDALQTEVAAQSDLLLAQYDLLQQVQTDLNRLGQAGGALGPVLIQASTQVIATLEARADRTDAQLMQLLAAVQALRETQRQALVNFGQGNTIGSVRMGDLVVGPKIVHEAFIPRPTAARAEEIAAALAQLDRMPTDALPPPGDTLPPGSWLNQLHRNHQFVGRSDDLLALARMLKGGQVVAVNQAATAVASGGGGVGKTQLAVEFAYRYGPFFSGVFWLNCAQPDVLGLEIARCGGAAHLQLFTEAAGLSLEEQVSLVRSRWACGVPYLLIFDNCEDPELLRAYRPGGACRVLLTSRRADWPGTLGVQRHPLAVLPRDASVALLHQHRPDLSAADADAIAAELGDLPLALHLAGRYLAGPGLRRTVAAYLDELRSPRLLQRLPLRDEDGSLPTGHRRDVARTFAISYDQLDATVPVDVTALALLARAAYLVPGTVIPTDLLLATLETDLTDWETQDGAEAAMQRLLNLGLLDADGSEGRRMHRLVGVYVRQVSGATAAWAAVERVVLARAAALDEEPMLAPLAAFIPILQGVTDAALPRSDADAAALSSWLGSQLERLTAYAAAHPYLTQALAIREAVLGPQHPDTAISLNDLAGLYEAQGEYGAAQPLLERALAIREAVLGPQHPDTARGLNNLAHLYQNQGEYGAAQPLLARALAIREAVLGPQHPDTAISLNDLALLYKAQGDYAAAQPLLARALAINEVVLGSQHPHTAITLGNLATLYYLQGDYAAAQPLDARSLAIHEAVLGPQHPHTAISLNNLAELYSAQGEYGAAQPLYTRALAIREAVLGPQHPDTATSLNNLAGLHYDQGEYGAAQPLYERALAIREAVLAPQHPDTAISLNNLANLYQNQGDYAAAQPLLERALAIQEAVLEPQHPDTATSLNNLAALYKAQGDYAAAQPLYERALAIDEVVLGPRHPTTASSLNNLASLYYAQGEYGAALPLYERALAIREQVLGPDHPHTRTIAENLATLRRDASPQA